MKRWALVGMAVAALAAFAGNVYDDAVFWFRGGKERVTANGQMETGEFFDDMHADDLAHANHSLPLKGYAENAVFATEPVVFPALGLSVTQDLQVLRIENHPHISADGAVTNRYPAWINPHKIFADNNISNCYTMAFRLRRDRNVNGDSANNTEWFAKIGYGSYGGRFNGLLMGFYGKDSTRDKYLFCYRSTLEGGNAGDSLGNVFYVPTNTWVDICLVVTGATLRVGMAAPMAITNSAGSIKTKAVQFHQIAMGAENCMLLPSGYYALFLETGTSAESSSAKSTGFLGSVQQVALWKRALSDTEIMEAFGMPRPSAFKTGLDNGASNEFGGTRTSPTQTIHSLEPWRELTNEMRAGDAWTVNFPIGVNDAGLAQMFYFRSLGTSEHAMVKVSVNGTVIGVKSVAPGSRVYWPVPGNLMRSRENTLTLTRTDSGGGPLYMDDMELSGSFQAGSGLSSESRFSSSDSWMASSNPYHWCGAITTYNAGSNVLCHVWMDPDAQKRCPAKFTTYSYPAKNTSELTEADALKVFVNGELKAMRDDVSKKWMTLEVPFGVGELNAGWNDIRLCAPPSKTGYWSIGYYRFEIELPKKGCYLILR